MEKEIRIAAFLEIQLTSFESRYVIILQEKSSPRTIEIIIDGYLAQIIFYSTQEIKGPRPLSHDLAINILEHLGAKIEKVVITDCKEDVFYALIYLRKDDKKIMTIDARPSDAIALAVKSKCPIFAEEKLLKAKILRPEESGDLINKPPASSWQM